ncbi:MAG TPA: AAA family ATPase [Acidimicrobiales bacterium]
MAPVLLGRSGELSALADAVQAVTTGTGRVVHITGEAGIGKSSLLAAAMDELDRRGVAQRSCTVDETDRRRRLALVRALLPEFDRHPDPDPVGAVVAVAERLAAAGPLALVADDVHWADDDSLDALRALAIRAGPLGILLLTAARPHPNSVGLRRLEEVTARGGVGLVPSALAPGDLAALAASRFGSTPGDGLASLLAGTGGNPFLAVELLAGLADEGRVVVRDGTLELDGGADMPEDLGTRLARRTLLAVPDAGLLLRAAAVLPGGFSVEELAALLDQPLTGVLATTLAAVEAGVLADNGVALAFRHDLLRRAVLDATPVSIVRSLHRWAADVLTQRGADPERITACVLAGCDPGDPADNERLVTVGRTMVDRNPGAAADLLARALEGTPPGNPRSTALALELGWALVAAGRATEVPALVDERLQNVPGPRPVDLLRLVGVALSLAGRADEVVARYADMDIEQLERDFDPDDADVVDAAAEMALLWVHSARFSEAARLLDWVDASPNPASPFREASAATARAWLNVVDGRFEAAVEHASVAVRAAQADQTARATPGVPALVSTLALDLLGDLDGALEVLGTSGAGVVAPRWILPLLQLATAVVYFRRGSWDDALAEADAGLLAAEEADLRLGVFWPYAIGALVACARGQQDTAHEWLDRSNAIVAEGVLGRDWLAYAHAIVGEADGDAERACSLLAFTAGRIIDARAPAFLLNIGADTVRLAVTTGRHQVADRVIDELHAMTTRTASPVAAAISGWAGGLRAGDHTAVEVGAQQLIGCRRIPEAARAHHDAAVLAARSGNAGEARRLAKEAFAAYDALGADRLHARLRADLRDGGLAMRPRRVPARATHGWASLTASEQTIVSLVGEGLTNTEIGQRLYISRRTVESHLGRVYDKLGLATRGQLVSAAVRHVGGGRDA